MLVEFDNSGYHIAQIVEWRSPAGPAHCLVRYQEKRPDGRPMAVASDIRTNPFLRGISGSFEVLADAFLESQRDRLSVAPESIIWIAHHGGFSSYDAPDQPTTFTRVDLTWDGTHYIGGYDRHHLLDARQAADLMRGFKLEPVDHVLGNLHWNT